jgi:carboxylesterase
VSTAADAPPVDPAYVEFHLHGDRRPACLLIHGFTGTPAETRGLGTHLHALGHTVLGIRLAGHGGDVLELERAGWEEWYAGVQSGARRLAAAGAPIVVVGVSAGALLALHLAHESPALVRGLVLIATAIAFRDWRARWALPLVARIPWLRERFRFMPKRGGSDIADDEVRRAHPGHRVVPMKGTLSLLALQRRVRAELPAITQPALVIHGALDRTCPASNVDLIAQALGTPPRTLILPRSAHVVTVDRERDRVLTAVAEFVTELGRDSQ